MRPASFSLTGYLVVSHGSMECVCEGWLKADTSLVLTLELIQIRISVARGNWTDKWSGIVDVVGAHPTLSHYLSI